MALAGSGRFRTGEPSQHTRTHAAVIGRFLDLPVAMTPDEGQWLVTIGNPRL
jgi:RNA 3'-terminal phosphate cyclase